MNFFEVFGLERKLAVDGEALQRQFYELSRRYHPDFHQGAPAAEQAAALEASARVNAAYRVLRDPVARVEYLVRLEEGRGDAEMREGTDPGARPPAPPALLEEMFEIQEALQDARAGGVDDEARATLTALRERLRERRAAEEARLTGELSAAWDAAGAGERPRLLAAFKEALAARAYLGTVIDDLEEALGAGGEGHVAHHRH